MKPALALAALLLAGTAGAQWDQAISDKDLLDPWVQAATVLQGLPAAGSGAATREILASLEAELSSLRTELENTAISIVARPEFVYDAAQRSFELSQRIGKVESGLDALFTALHIRERPDAKSVQDSFDNLKKILAGRTRFERDILTTVGTGSKNAIQALAARWWTAADRVNDVAQATRALRDRPH